MTIHNAQTLFNGRRNEMFVALEACSNLLDTWEQLLLMNEAPILGDYLKAERRTLEALRQLDKLELWSMQYRKLAMAGETPRLVSVS